MMTVNFNARRCRAVVAVLVVATGVLGAAVVAQDRRPHRIVFEVTSGDNQVWEAVLNNIENVQRALGIEEKSVSLRTAGESAWKEDLLSAAGTVDSGVAQVVRLQEAGWSYIKSGS